MLYKMVGRERNQREKGMLHCSANECPPQMRRPPCARARSTPSVLPKQVRAAPLRRHVGDIQALMLYASLHAAAATGRVEPVQKRLVASGATSKMSKQTESVTPPSARARAAASSPMKIERFNTRNV